MRRDAKTSILEATLQLIAAGGVDAVRYRAVARAAKLQLGTVSYHFAAREDLIRAAFAFFLTENTAALVALRGRFASGGLDAVADYLTELVRADCADRRRRHLAEYELIVYAARDAAIAAALAAWDRARGAELALALEDLGVTRPSAAARTLIDIVRGFQLANLGCARPDLDDLRSRLYDVVRSFAPARNAKPPQAARRKAR